MNTKRTLSIILLILGVGLFLSFSFKDIVNVYINSLGVFTSYVLFFLSIGIFVFGVLLFLKCDKEKSDKKIGLYVRQFHRIR